MSGFNGCLEGNAVHEYGVTERIVRIVNDTASAHHADRVLTVDLVIGENTSIVADSVQLYYDIIAQGTPAAGARLRVRMVEARMHCPHCDTTFKRPRFSFSCPTCGEMGQPTEIGNECYVERVELEND